MKKLLLSAALLPVLAAPASATLQISISDGATTFTCFDGQAGCDLGGGAKNLLTLNTVVGGFNVFGTLSLSTSGSVNNLSLSSFGIVNNGGSEGTLTLLVSDTGFTGPVSAITESASLTFNNNVGAGDSTLKFWADPNDVQGANPNNTPGTLLFTTSGAAAQNPDSFSGSNDSAFSALAPFSMTEGASIDLLAGGSITGFNQDMLSSFNAVPEPSTWAMLGLGFGALGLMGFSRKRRERALSFPF